MMGDRMDPETVLRHLFGTIATRCCGEASYGAGVYAQDGVLCFICPMCVLITAPMEGETYADRELAEFGDLPLIKISSPGKMMPEVYLDKDVIALNGRQAGLFLEDGMHMIPVTRPPQKLRAGLLLASSYGQRNGEYEAVELVEPRIQIECMGSMKLLVYSAPQDVKDVLEECNATIDMFKPCIMQTRLQLQPVLVLSCDEALLYMPLRTRKGSDTMTAVRFKDGGVLSGDGWSDDQQSFRKLIYRKQAMKGMLKNPLAGAPAAAAAAPARKDAIRPVAKPAPEPDPEEVEAEEQEVGQVAAADIVEQADGTQPGVAAAVATRVDTAVKPADDGEAEGASEEEEDQPEAQEQTAETAIADLAAPAETTAEKTKAQRRQKPVAQGGIKSLELAEAQRILQVNVASIDSSELEEAQNALRTLRDILISATRLQTNIALAIANTVKSGADKSEMDKLAAIQKILSGK